MTVSQIVRFFFPFQFGKGKDKNRQVEFGGTVNAARGEFNPVIKSYGNIASIRTIAMTTGSASIAELPKG